MFRISSGDHPPSYWNHLLGDIQLGHEADNLPASSAKAEREAILPLPICLFDMFRDFTFTTAQHY